MTNLISTASIAFPRYGLPHLKLPKLGVGAAIATLARAIGQALEMAYVTPYQTTRRPPSAAIDADLQGRDPNW
jgi:hypothetical protein